MVKIVILSTSAAYLGEHPTGVWLEEVASPYYHFKGKGHEVVLASIAGGAVPIDGGSLAGDFFTDACKKFMHDGEAVAALGHTVKLTALDLNSVDVLYLAGGHGTCVDFADNKDLKKAIETIYAAKKIVAADCHGPIALAQCNKPDGTPLVKGLKCTGFSNSEEDAVQLTSAVPFLIETRFKEQGGKYEAKPDWNSHATVDGNLICGQNPQSSDECALAVIAFLKK
jgi:putative intracellular protease/amidase